MNTCKWLADGFDTGTTRAGVSGHFQQHIGNNFCCFCFVSITEARGSPQPTLPELLLGSHYHKYWNMLWWPWNHQPREAADRAWPSCGKQGVLRGHLQGYLKHSSCSQLTAFSLPRLQQSRGKSVSCAQQKPHRNPSPLPRCQLLWFSWTFWNSF